MLANLVKAKTGAKVRGIELSLLQRCAAHIASETDIEEAYSAGKRAVEEAVKGTTGYMVAFHRQMDDGKYRCELTLVPLASTANYEKKIPLAWINDEHNGVKQELIEDTASAVIDVLQARALTEAVCTDLEKHAYSVNDRIEDASVRNLHILYAV